MNKRLIEYIKTNLSRGVPLKQIREILILRGWPENEVDEAINLATTNKTPKLLLIIPIIISIFVFIFWKLRLPIECENDFDCFIDAAENCKLAKVIHKAELELFGVKVKGTTFFKIEGKEGNKCVLYMKIEKMDIEFPPGTPQDIINQQTELIKKFEGTDGSCKFDQSNLITFLNKIKNGNFRGEISCTFVNKKWECNYTDDWSLAEDCQGNFFKYKNIF